MARRRVWLAAAGVVAAVAGCGGADPAEPPLERVAAGERRFALAAPPDVDPAASATRLLDFAEQSYPALFPGPQADRRLSSWVYRHYPATQTYIAVIDGRVYVAGGPFGADVHDVGAVSDHVTPVSKPDEPPAVRLSGPAAGAVFTAPATVTLTAEASDDRRVAAVQFFAGADLLGEDRSAPYSVTWADVPAGTTTLRARAIDDAGAEGWSNPVTITVDAPPASPPGILTAAQLARCPDASNAVQPNFYACMVGSLTGTQLFDPARPCTLSISDAGVFTLQSGSEVFRIGTFGRTSFTKSSELRIHVYSPFDVESALYIAISSNVDSFSFVHGGALTVDAESVDQSLAPEIRKALSCRFAVPPL